MPPVAVVPQLTILSKKQMLPEKYNNLELLPDVEVPQAPKRPRQSTLKLTAAKPPAALVADDDDDFQT